MPFVVVATHPVGLGERVLVSVAPQGGRYAHLPSILHIYYTDGRFRDMHKDRHSR